MLCPLNCGSLMAGIDAYLFYEAGQAVAAVHLGLKVRHVSGNPALQATDIVIPRGDVKSRMILWLTGMAAEKKGVGKSDPLRRMRNRARVRTLIDSIMTDLTGPVAKRRSKARQVLNQAQDRANAICAQLYAAIEALVLELKRVGVVLGQKAMEIVAKVKHEQNKRQPR